MSPRVTLKSIAQDLGLSHMTVSRALSGHPAVLAETRRAVQERAQALGYVRNAAAGAMRGKPTCIVGLLLPTLANEFYARFADHMAQACTGRGLHLVIHLTNDDPQVERQAIHRLREVQADAVVMVPTPMPAAETEAASLPMRTIQLIRRRGHGPAVLVDDDGVMAAAVGHLVAQGHRRIGFVGGTPDLSSGRARLAAFCGALKQHGINPVKALIATAAPSFHAGFEMASALIGGGQAMTALVCGGFEISSGALEACLDRRLRFPDDLAFVGYGDPAANRWIAGGITAIGLPITDMAEAAVRLLDDGAMLPDTTEPMLVFGATLTIRAST